MLQDRANPQERLMIRRVLAVVLTVSAISSTVVSGQDNTTPLAFPDTLAGRRLQAYFDAYAGGTDDAIRDFQQKHGRPGSPAIETRIAKAKKFRKTWGVLTPRIILFSGERMLNVLSENVEEKKWFRCELRLERTEPYWFKGVALYPATGPELCIQSHGTKDLAEAVARFQMAARVPALAVGTIRGNEIETAVAGVRRFDAAEAVEKDDRFHLGSVTKSITATLIGRLVEQELLSWGSTLGELLPDIEMRPEYRDVTVEELLQHRSGLPKFSSTDEFRAATEGSKLNERTAFAAAALKIKPVVEPHKEYRYSNAGYGIAGLLAERASGRTWEELLEKEVFQPLGMRNAGFGWPAALSRKDQPFGHRMKEDGSLQLQELGKQGLTKAAAPAGDVHCSIHDFARYASFHLQALRGCDGVLKAETIKRLHTPIPGSSSGFSYAGGWFIQHVRIPERHTHGGSGGSFLAVVVLEPDSNIGVVVAANARQVTELNTIADSLLDWLRSS